MEYATPPLLEVDPELTKIIGSFDVSRIRDIEWNNDPFDSLVLPDGYKDLILSFVESQIKEGDAFDDVINGKGEPIQSV